MKVILREQVRSLGNVGDIVNVSSGYARNFLIPKKYAVLADENNKRFIVDLQRRLSKKIEEHKKNALELKKSIDQLETIDLPKRVAGNGKLFGAVTNTELSKELALRDILVERKWFVLDTPIKDLGKIEVKIKLFSGIEGNLKLNIFMDPKQAEEIQKKTQEKKRVQKEKEEKKENEKPEEEKAEAVETAEEGKETLISKEDDSSSTKKKSKKAPKTKKQSKNDK